MELPVRPPLPVDACTTVLRNALLADDFAVGDRLPAERALADRFQVSRPTLRSALDRLVCEGLLSVRQGRGYEVLDFRHSGGPDLVSALLRIGDREESEAAVEELLLLRRAFARVLLVKLHASRSPTNTAHLSSAVEAFAARVSEGAGTRALADADIAIIRVMVEQTESLVLGLFLNSMLGILSALPALRSAVYQNPLRNLQSHRAVVAWLASGNKEQVGILLEAVAEHDAATLGRFRELRQ